MEAGNGSLRRGAGGAGSRGCRHAHAAPRAAAVQSQVLTQSTRFTSTRVHILTPEDLRARAEAAVATERRQLAFAHKRLVRLEVGTLDIHYFLGRAKLTAPQGGDAR